MLCLVRLHKNEEGILVADENCSGLQPRAVQGMLDFDFICKRKTPSVAGIIYTFGGQFVSKM